MARRNLVRLTGGLELFVALSAVAGGFGLMSSRRGDRLGMSPDILAGTPFPDFFIPGLLLFAIVGLGSAAAFVAVAAGSRWAPHISLAVGAVLAGWILVQVALVGYLSPLQPLYLAVGLTIAWLSARWLRAPPATR